MTEVEKIKDTERWPLWPILPVKNTKIKDKLNYNWPRLGVMIAEQGPVVFECLMCAIPKDLTTVKQYKYNSVEELVEAGWVGD